MQNVTRAVPRHTPILRSSSAGSNNFGGTPGQKFRIIFAAGAGIEISSNPASDTLTVDTVLPFNEHGWYETPEGAMLTIDQPAGSVVGYQLV
jgi:hypothetical protein